MIKVNEFLNYKQRVENLIHKKAFCSRLLFQVLIDDYFFDEINPYINYFEKAQYNPDALDDILMELHQKTQLYYEKAKLHKRNRINNCLKSLAFFYFLESMDEHSVYSDVLLSKIKEKYGDNYLEVLTNLDRHNLSEDIKKLKSATKDSKYDNDCIYLKTYVILKKWQDIQHDYFDGEFGTDTTKYQAEYCKNKALSPFDIDFLTLRRFLFNKVKKNKVIDLDTISLLCGLYIKKYVIKLVGGKMYGLGLLNLYGIKVPETYIIPTSTRIQPTHLVFLKEQINRFAVRSSANIEDGESASFAGMFDSYLDVPFDNLFDAVNKVRESVNNKRLKSYNSVLNNKKPQMAVIIQKYIEPDCAGVWIGNSLNEGILEWVDGNGEKLVSGAVTPNSEIWDGSHNISSNYKINSANGAVALDLIKFQQTLDSVADFEWMIINNELIMLQFRPVTKKVEVRKVVDNDKNEIVGIPASPGKTTSLAYFVNNYDEEVQTNKILLSHMTDPKWIPHLLKARGAVTAVGGYLCHTAIICRELGIPCITGIGNDGMNQILEHSSNILTIDGNNGTIKIN